MKTTEDTRQLLPEELSPVSGGAYLPGTYKEEANNFLRQRMDQTTFERIMSHKDGRMHPYVAAKIYLSEPDWEKYIWIERHGSLEGYPW